MWYTIVVTLVVDIGGLLLVYALLRDRVRRVTSAAAQIAELRDEVSRLVVELNQTTERNVALVEHRIGSLNDLLTAADRKIGLLRREMEKHDVGAQVYSRLAEGRSAGPRNNAADARGNAPGAKENRSQASPVTDISTEAGRPAAGGAPEAQQAPGAGDALEASAGAARARPGVTPEPREEMHRRVMTLSRAGFSPSLIAARVGVPLGEVELIISLERQRASQGATAPGAGQE